MSKTSGRISSPLPDAKPARKRAPGGKRPGSGRPPGALNRKTIARQRRIQREMQKVLATIPHDQIESMDAVDTLRFAMHAYLKSNDLAAAVSVARDLAPYQRPKVATTPPDAAPLPEDLAPDPPPTNDEEGPEHPIL
jgi:hypothetical protein